MKIVNDYSLRLGRSEYVPIIIGGMGVHFSSPAMALEAARLGGIGHISDAMVPFVSDKRFGTSYTQTKFKQFESLVNGFDKSAIRFNLNDLREAQYRFVSDTMSRKQGRGAVFVNIMEKLTMAAPLETLAVRLNAALDGGIDGITLSAGLHQHSMKMMEDNKRFRDAKIGIIVSSGRALKIFLRSAQRVSRLPDYVIVEGPLAGGHLGFGEDWQNYDLHRIVKEVLQLLLDEDLNIPVIPAGGIFTGGEAVEFLESGAAGVQVATRFTVTKECGIPDESKQRYFEAREENVVVTCHSPTGYLIRMLDYSPCLKKSVKPNCEAFGYTLTNEGRCQYLDAYSQAQAANGSGVREVGGKVCLCYHFSRSSCFTCGHNVYRLKDTTIRRPDGSYQVLTVEHVFKDYQFSQGNEVKLPEPEVECSQVAI